MATSAAGSSTFSGRPNYDLILYIQLWAISGNSSQWSWQLYARHLSGGISYVLDGKPWAVSIGPNSWGSSAALDFRNTNSILLGSGYTTFFAHDANGNCYIPFSASMGPAGIFGNAGFSTAFTADRIAQVPGQPPAATVYPPTSSSLTFNIALPADNGGSAVIDFDIALASDAAFTDIVATRGGVTGAYQPFTGLLPATTYYFRYRARNAVGHSALSPTTAYATLAAAPSVPLSPTISNLAPTGLTFSWLTPTTDGGSPITGYRITRALDPGFTLSAVQYDQGVVLSKAFTDMLPSTTYYLKVEAKNAVGYGPPTNYQLATTVSGVSFSNGTAWTPAGIFVSDGTNWTPAEIYVSDGTNWIAAV